MIFASPWAFFFLIGLILPAILYVRRRNREQGVVFSSIYPLSAGVISLRQRFLWLPKTLFLLGVILLITALARPMGRLEETKKVTQGVAIEIAVDRSSSMNAEIEMNNTFIRRLDIVKETLLDFILGNGKKLHGRPDDLLGLIAFARYADTLSPLSLSHAIVTDLTESLETVTVEAEDGTSIGDALALAAARLKSVSSSNDPEKGYDITSKIIILLTDGENNAGKYSPREAAELAAQWGIKVYAIGFGGTAYYPVSGFFGQQRVPVGSAVDAAALKEIAEITGGEYFQADSEEDLLQVYAMIDALEKTKIDSFSRYTYKELFVPFVLWGLLLLALSVILDATILRRIP